MISTNNGYIYIRNHPSYDVDDACKMGKANNIPERDTQYSTGEIKRGYFEAGFEVPIEKIVTNSYSLNYAEYMKDETEEQYEDGVVVKTLGEVCKFLSKSKRQASYGEKYGEYPFYTSSQNCSKYCDEYDYEDECLIIGTGGNANIKYSKIW